MIRPPDIKKPHGGNREASDNTRALASDSEGKDNPPASAALFLAVVAIDAARDQLDQYALATDDPDPETVTAADLLDVARALLGGEVGL